MKERIQYPVLSMRADQEIKDWFVAESFKYRSWNIFLRELKKRYEERE